ncbi:MAG: VOC family protein [Rhodosalinus sp.]
MQWKPEGYTSVAPYLIVSDAQATLDFARAVFGAETLRVMRGDSGAITRAEMRIDDTVVMLGQAPGGPGAQVHVYVADPEAAQRTALAHGAEEVQPVQGQPGGERSGGVRDANGITWWMGRSKG